MTRSPRWRQVAAALIAACAVVALAGCAASDDSTERGGSEEALADLPDLTDCPDASGQPASGEQTLAELTLPCLDGGGGEFVIGQAAGVPMVVNLWASWCGPCREELPYFADLYEAADPTLLLVVGVVTRDSATLAAEFATDLGIDFPSALDENGDLYAAQGLRGLPGTFFLDAAGGVTHAELAPIASYADLVALVEEHLGVVV